MGRHLMRNNFIQEVKTDIQQASEGELELNQIILQMGLLHIHEVGKKKFIPLSDSYSKAMCKICRCLSYNIWNANSERNVYIYSIN